MREIKTEVKPRTEKVSLPEHLGFGIHFTDNMFEMDYSEAEGWHNAVIRPVGNFSLHPATTFFHYGQSLFEGLKVFKQENEDIVMFRADKHFARLNNSARRLCMPEVDVDFALEALKELVTVEKDWIPAKDGEALYVRPFMFGTDAALGVRPSVTYKFVIILSPVGAYYAEGFKPVKILVQDEYVRAVRKGLGECKTPGNYAASMIGGEIAHKQGYTQVLWLDAIELKYLEEVGTMNMFIAFNDEIVTPALTGGILSGITRMSVLQILREWGLNVTERQVSIDEVVSRYDKGEVVDLFGTGTAAIISSVGELKYKDKVMVINNGQPGALAQKLFNFITGVQYGHSPDTFGWLKHVDVEVPA